MIIKTKENANRMHTFDYGVILTHWGRVTHICVGNLIIIGQDNGLSPGRRQAIIWTNAGMLWIGPWGTNFSEILIGIHTFSSKKIHSKVSSAKCCSFRLGLNVLKTRYLSKLASLSVSWLRGPRWQGCYCVIFIFCCFIKSVPNNGLMFLE